MDLDSKSKIVSKIFKGYGIKMKCLRNRSRKESDTKIIWRKKAI